MYRKKTHMDNYLHLHSHHPLTHKIAVTCTLISRAQSVCSSAPVWWDEERHIVQSSEIIPSSSHHPEHFARQQPLPNIERQKAILCNSVHLEALWVIRQVLTPLRIRTCSRPHQTLSQVLVHPKDPFPPDQLKGVLYRIPCSDCGLTYVGQTAGAYSSSPHERTHEPHQSAGLSPSRTCCGQLTQNCLASNLHSNRWSVMCHRGLGHPFTTPTMEQRDQSPMSLHRSPSINTKDGTYEHRCCWIPVIHDQRCSHSSKKPQQSLCLLVPGVKFSVPHFRKCGHIVISICCRK